MKLQFIAAVFLSIWSLVISQDFGTSLLPQPQRRHFLIDHTVKHSHPTSRIPGISPFIPSKGGQRILNKTPSSLLQNGPYYANPYYYCDNPHTSLDQIKAGTFSRDKNIQHLNLHSVDGFTGNKEFHVLHLPKDKHHNFDDVNLQLSLLNAHKSPEVPEIDLELNKHLGNFEITLEDIKAPDLDTSLLYTRNPSANDIVTPLIQGHVSTGHNHKHNNNLIQLADYLNENSHGQKDHILQHFGAFGGSHNINTRGEGDILDLPHFEKHPLEYDPSQASYDTPGAVDSYGHPATESPLPNSHLNFNIGSFSNGFGNGFKGNELYQSEEYINQLNEINGLQRRRRMDSYKSSTATPTSQETQDQEDIRHLNHKYD